MGVLLRFIKKFLRGFGALLGGLMELVCILAVVLGIAVGPLFANAITMYTGAKDYKVEGGTDATYFASDYADADEQYDAAAQLAREVEAGGIVLVRNDDVADDPALPLARGSRVTLLGQDAVDFVYGGSGSGSVDSSKADTRKQALEQAGLEVNPTAWDFYEEGPGKDYRKKTPDVTGKGDYAVNECPVSEFTDELCDSYANYSDAAVVVIGRSGGESSDLPVSYLALTQEEKDLLHEARAHFDRVVVVLNTANPITLGDLADADAVLWVGSPGQAGIDAVGDVLAGLVNPSGRLVDTYASDPASAPAMQNFGNYLIANGNQTHDFLDPDTKPYAKYLSYSEGIYVGYRYYETRYEDSVLGQGNAGDFDYASEVDAPFGHGLSYTSFDWANYTVDKTDDGYVASVDVTNTGDVAGRDVAELYLQRPYTDYDRANAIEKPAVELAGFAKTELLEPGETQHLTITVKQEQLRTYDSWSAGTYILESGTYYLALARDAHEATNDVLAAKGKTAADGMDAAGDAARAYSWDIAGQQDGKKDAAVAADADDTKTDDAADTDATPSADTNVFSTAETGKEIHNQFDSADLRTWDDGFTYLSRADWQGTWPETYAGGSWTAPQAFIDAMEVAQPAGDTTEPAGSAADMPVFSTTDEQYGHLSLASLVGLPYDDARWDALIGQMSKQELWNLVRQSGYVSLAIPSIDMPLVTLKDGPAGISATLTGGGVDCMSYPIEMVLASTYDTQLVEQMGQMVGEDSLASGVAVWYAPSMNIHRTAASGRNFEYYSEDPLLSGAMGAAETRGVQSKGAVVTIKHYALNDEETNRYGVAVLANEQSIRELYLAPFEMSVREGGAKGVMASMNRVGPTWSGATEGLMTGTLRDEWGFTGFVTTDQATFPTFEYCGIYQGLGAGADMWLNDADLMNNVDVDKISDADWANVRQAAHRILYTYANSNAMNGISADARITASAVPQWRLLLLALVVFAGLLGYAFAKLFHACTRTRTLWQVIRKKPRKK